MSGFTGRDAFDLDATKALYWHRFCRCGASSLDAIVRRHLEPAGFCVVKWGRTYAAGVSYVRVTGPGLSERQSEPLYQAVAYPPAVA